MTAVATHPHHGEDEAQSRANLLLGVRLGILSEIMLFGALFAAYFVERAASIGWPPSASGLDRPELLLPALNTVLLVSSSLTMQLTVGAARAGTRSRLLRWLGSTILLGGVFLLVQAFEFLTNGFGLSSGIFGSTFYILTGFHGAHVLAGLILLAIVFNRARRGLITADRHTAVEASSYYWHFVDVVWLFLFTTLYAL